MKSRIKTYIYIIIIVVSIVLLPHNVSAQDFYYSQYEHTPLSINPALLSTEKDIKLSLHYHQNELWKELNMRNFQMSLVYPLSFIKNEGMPQSVGLSIASNNTGKQGLVNNTGVNLAFTQGVTINRWSVLSAGFQASYFFYSNSNPNNYTTGSQWVDGTGYIPLQGINETINFETIKLFTVNTGVNWHITDGAMPKGNLGVSVYYLNKPKYSFLNENNRINARYVAHGDYRLFTLKSISISPRALFVYQDVSIISLGALIGYSIKSDNPFLIFRDCNLQLGLDYRYNHSTIVNFAIEQSKYILGISYALGLNKDKVYANYGSNLEVCLVLKFNKGKRRSVSQSEYKIGETRLIFNKGIDNSKTIESNKSESKNNYRSDSVIITGEKYQVQLRQDFKFKFNDATLTEGAKSYLDDLAKMLKQNPILKVEVIGHTDDVGTEEANQKIAGQRAKIVIDFLVSKGINPLRLKPTSKGKSEPLVPNSNEENKAKNRRVEFIIYSE